MSVPMRKDEPSEEDVRVQELTTADLAQSKRPSVSEDRLKQDRPKEDRLKEDPLRPALADPLPGEAVQNNVSGTPSTTSSAISAGSSASDTTPLFPNSELEALRTRWSEVQTDFVDEPRRAVEQADSLVASAMKRLAEVFAEERSKLEGQWDRGDNISTEDLRIALQRYRSFFHRLLSI